MFFNSVKEINRLRKEINWLLSKKNVKYLLKSKNVRELNVTIEKN